MSEERKITRQNRRVMAALTIAQRMIAIELRDQDEFQSVMELYDLDLNDRLKIEVELRIIVRYLQGRQFKNGSNAFYNERARRMREAQYEREWE